MDSIPVSRLVELGACINQIKIIRMEWGNTIPVNEQSLKRAVELHLDLEWLSVNLLTAPALAEYKKIEGRALAEYKKIEGRALAEYEKIQGPAWAEYKKIQGPAWAEYKKIEGRALLSALLSM